MFKHASNIVCISSKDPEFVIHSNDGVTISQRAAISINENCPQDVARQLLVALQEKWIEPVSYMKDSEYLIAKLSQND